MGIPTIATHPLLDLLPKLEGRPEIVDSPGYGEIWENRHLKAFAGHGAENIARELWDK